jgi:hypothetical protein
MSHMAKKDDAVEQTVTIKRKTLVTAGWIAGGVLALGATFAAGAALAQVADSHRGGGDFAAERTAGPGHVRPQGGQGMGDGDGEYNDDQAEHGPSDGDGEYNDDGGMGGMMAPPAPMSPNDDSTTPAPTTTP